ncbi:MAG: sugar ABC transporter substrate-binding protein, partial [Pseudomonadota bacterium]
MIKRDFMAAVAAIGLGVVPLATSASAQDLPPLEKKDRYKVGFSQMESNNPWRIAETKSFHDTAEACNWDLVA